MQISFVIESQFNVETKVVVADFTGGKEMYTEIGPQLTGLDIGVLGECLCVRACICVCGYAFLYTCLSTSQ